MNAKQALLKSLDEEIRKETLKLISLFGLTEQNQAELIKNQADLALAKEKSIASRVDIEKILEKDKGERKKAFISAMRSAMKCFEESEIDYSSFPAPHTRDEKIEVLKEDILLGFGRCPCPIDGEKTRCCKLRTLDVITQCAFSCSYCSVQAFYDKNRIRVVSNLKEKLKGLVLTNDIWHIGTGQASDSLFLGDDYGTLSDLSDFASSHPDIIIELKSKSARDVFNRKYPKNLIFTWSLNAETVIEKEERKTAKLEKRLEAAERARDNGSLVGFHIHPMVHFKGWQDEYSALAEKIEKRFSPSEILMISAGTLIFTKENLRFIREKKVSTRILQMEKTLTAGKYSYPFKVRKEMFSHLFSSFSKDFLSDVFTYLCLEDPSLWAPALGREYKSDKDFESDMRRSYFAKVSQALR